VKEKGKKLRRYNNDFRFHPSSEAVGVGDYLKGVGETKVRKALMFILLNMQDIISPFPTIFSEVMSALEREMRLF
jgi:hypothetical protein